MQIRKGVYFAALAATLTLAGCDTMDHLVKKRPSGGTPISDVPTTPPPSSAQGNTDAASKPPTPSSSVASSSLIMYVASRTPVQGYTAVRQNDVLVYVDPTQTLTRNDLQNAVATRNSEGKAFVKLEFSTTGKQRLASLTSSNIGKSFAVTQKNRLISIINIGKPITSGVLYVPMSSEQAATSFEDQILDGE
ncbi:hypothetical protein CAP48_11725 [Advenella sp. S44]|uniref:SecDF P1 head subdomain-containing protein n=1 Tax=Advenella sp. S44 TaxID=1982755 RepID=UPI000C2A7A14|nr:hypothetical protein [Advenella sp. S44]PJX23748.1 hypothetical protein CAP48_11725 [Advenella sp. S44]